MSQETQKKVRLGKKEKEIINFLKEKDGSVWKEEIIYVEPKIVLLQDEHDILKFLK